MDQKKLEQMLSQLHSELAQTLLDKIQSDGVTAADLNVARQFLKDNGIDGVPKKGSPLGNLAEQLPSFEDEDMPSTRPN